eukprot:3472311-Rhodomonas_salina.1
MAHKTEHSESSILEVAALGKAVQASLKALFSEQAGSSVGWNIPKFHAIRHVPQLLVMFRCWENVSTQ